MHIDADAAWMTAVGAWRDSHGRYLHLDDMITSDGSNTHEAIPSCQTGWYSAPTMYDWVKMVDWDTCSSESDTTAGDTGSYNSAMEEAFEEVFA